MTVHLYCGITDMRKSINTLAIMVQDVLQMEPTNGHLFLFRSRGGAKLKNKDTVAVAPFPRRFRTKFFHKNL